MIEFNSYFGICNNLHHFINERNISEYYDYEKELHKQFISAGLNEVYPFDTQELKFDNEKDNRLNELRVNWVKDHVKNPPFDQSEVLTKFYTAWLEWAEDFLSTNG